MHISSKEISTGCITMCDRITNPIGLQISVGGKLRATYKFKIMEFNFYIQLYRTHVYVEVI